MTVHNSIVLSGAPAGRFLEGIVSGTPKPGTVMQVKAATEPVGGKHTWEVYAPGTDGNQRIISVLIDNWFLGRAPTEAYVSGEQCRLYCPIPGDELKMLLKNISGTGDLFAIGAVLMVDDATGKLIATTGSPESEPFVCMETVAALTADTLAHCMFTGY